MFELQRQNEALRECNMGLCQTNANICSDNEQHVLTMLTQTFEVKKNADIACHKIEDAVNSLIDVVSKAQWKDTNPQDTVAIRLLIEQS